MIDELTLKEGKGEGHQRARFDGGRFVRSCMEVVHQETLSATFSLNDKVYKVEYEGLKLICFYSGGFRHRSEECSMVNQEASKYKQAIPPLQQQQQHVPTVAGLFGELMISKYDFGKSKRNNQVGAKVTGNLNGQKSGAHSRQDRVPKSCMARR